jgi:hypothetical protein
MPEFEPPLSPLGQRRRERILDLALAEARGRRRRRRAARTTVALVLTSILVLAFLRSRPAQQPQLAVQSHQPHPAIPTGPLPQPSHAIVVARIETDPNIIERLAIRPEPFHVTVINDNELLNALAMAHRPAGLAYVNGKATLLFR